MMDQVGIINTETNEIELIVETEFSDMNNNETVNVADIVVMIETILAE